MRILGVYLENIRSYRKSCLVIPPKDVITIYGPTGSGKTSLLMAIRFALFGLPKGVEKGLFDAYKNPHGSDLLRVDSPRGKVRLLLLHRGKLYLVERVIERRGDSYNSTLGSIEEYEIEEGRVKLKSRKTTYARSELDEYVINLLGIREKKSEKGSATPLVYSTALYVPQFNIHEVLQLDEKERIEIIERALGLDKYKMYKYNYEKVSKKLDELIREKTQIYNFHRENLMKKNKDKLAKELDSKRVELTRFENEEKILDSEYSRVKELGEEIRREIQKLENERKSLHGEIETYNEKLSKLKEAENLIAEKIKASLINEDVLREYIDRLNDRIEELRGAIDEINKTLEDLYQEIDSKEKEKANIDHEYYNMNAQLAALNKEIDITRSRFEALEKERDKIENLINKGLCPVCRQLIPHEHGRKLLKEITYELESLRVKLHDLQRQVDEIVKRRESIAENRNNIDKIIYEYKLRIQDLTRRRERLLQDIQRTLEFKSEIASLINNWRELRGEVSRIDIKAVHDLIENIEKEIKSKKDILTQVEQNLNIILKKRTEIARYIGGLRELINSIEKQLAEITSLEKESEKLREELNSLKNIKDLFEYSYKAVEEIEKQVLKRLIDEFRIFFYQYLNALIRDQPVEVVVTDDFNVVEKIRVGGTVYKAPSLSGGQNIAISLAYRLALNQVVRRHSKFLHKSVLILDEPTTGFSAELVLRLKELLRNMSGEEGQVIVVTHDSTLIEAGDCRIKLTLNLERHETSIEYEECIIDEDYRELVEKILLSQVGFQQQEITSVRKGEFEPRVESEKPGSIKFV
ncbi:MAG: SMC family ATPase [Desulfurococcaceae archaeon]